MNDSALRISKNVVEHAIECGTKYAGSQYTREEKLRIIELYVNNFCRLYSENVSHQINEDFSNNAIKHIEYCTNYFIP